MLRNAFEEMLTERTGRLILAAVNVARDTADRVRVIIDNQVPVTTYLAQSSTAGTYRNWYDVHAAFMLDQREIQRQASLINGEMARERWTYS